MNYQVADFERLDAFSDEDLLASLGESLTKGQAGIGEPSREENLEEGANWWQENLEELKKLFCESELLRNVPERSKEPRFQVVTLIADSIAQHFTIVPPLTIAFLLVRLGHDQLCGKGTPPVL